MNYSTSAVVNIVLSQLLENRVQIADKADHAKSYVFTARCTLVQSAVLRSHVVCLSVCLSVCL